MYWTIPDSLCFEPFDLRAHAEFQKGCEIEWAISLRRGRLGVCTWSGRYRCAVSWQSFAVRAASWIEHEWFIVERKSWKRTVNGWEGNKKSGGNEGRDGWDGSRYIMWEQVGVRSAKGMDLIGLRHRDSHAPRKLR
ncbi:hypothetical protein SCLCIDRAFT_1224347 [Scleroderma citrinum Foug A]|uniref:Uncharacterized protein n=1 Tax=Scleroderma citrinum Foug A TaxID=1036808 RepID=A0A0C3D6B9_9AGAM|nr:hypothetical protein SCLCIDRAFT_1224347 [Scleroderma citrinum Foug A]